jgi:hypothetical protein
VEVGWATMAEVGRNGEFGKHGDEMWWGWRAAFV